MSVHFLAESDRRVKFLFHVRSIYYARLRIPGGGSTPGNG